MFLKLAKHRLLFSYIMAALAIVFAPKHLFYPALIIIGIGAAIRIWAAGYVKKNDVLAIVGPYSYVRNPLYFGTFVAALGAFILIQNWWLTILFILVFVLFYGAAIRSEEIFLQDKFGDEFAEYSKNVKAFLPRLTPYKSDQDSKFSWEMVKKNHEYKSLTCTIASVLMIFLIAYLRK